MKMTKLNIAVLTTISRLVLSDISHVTGIVKMILTSDALSQVLQPHPSP
jgi:hypothetical protein